MSTIEESLVISLGGSLVSTHDGIAVEYLAAFKKILGAAIIQGMHFVIVVGGGKVCRLYQDAAKQLTHPSDNDLDWIGIMSTRLNGYLVKVALGEWAYSEMVLSLETFPCEKHGVVVAEPWKPGRTSDGPSVEIAMHQHATTIVNLTNIDYVYDKDPKKFPDAKRLVKLSWGEYIAMIGGEKAYEPGGNYPFDPVASAMAHKAGIKVVLMKGDDLENFEKYLKGEEWKGTTITDTI